ncbi:uncharacterized protein BKCO1_200058 [Diplodia corticola]|uniref:Uncharacterized protein n=1 Tax=Diplodia corticola TaxID=236234 RepID=A0A1J9RH95_9PEZI|nr:uncharacterized protein BKCO1_200058 [Diplodia corticola]OJD39984.1 hypothetical protein BKCO1_200058 [Diplodia corticola]
MVQPSSGTPGVSELDLIVEISSVAEHDAGGRAESAQMRGEVVACRGRRRNKAFSLLWPCSRLDDEHGRIPPEHYNRSVEVYCRIDGSERRRFAIARFDTQCSTNLVSARWLRANNIEPRRLDRIPDGPERISRLEGSNDLVGRVSMAWYGEDRSYKNQQVHLKPRTIWNEFRVVEPGEGFDMIIGQETIQTERLFQKEWFCYTQTTQGGHIPCRISLSAQERQAAEEARKRERAMQEEARRQRESQAARSSHPRPGRPGRP